MKTLDIDNVMNLNPLVVRREVTQLLSRRKRIRMAKLQKQTDFNRLGLDLVDVVDLILDVEKAYGLTIPDEVPLNTIDDFVQFICLAPIRQAS